MTLERLVIDSSPLNYFARSNQLAVLEKLFSGKQCLITKAVEEELLRGGTRHAQLYQASAQSWISVVNETALDHLVLFSEYHGRLGRGSRNIGESTTLAYAEFHDIVAVVDDRAGRKQGSARGVKLTGTLELICEGIRNGLLGSDQAVRIVGSGRDGSFDGQPV